MLKAVFLFIITGLWFAGIPAKAKGTDLSKFLPQYTPAPAPELPFDLHFNNENPKPLNIKDRILAEELTYKIKKRHDEEFGPTSTTHLNTDYPQLTQLEFGYMSRTFHGHYIYLNDRTKLFGDYASREILNFHLDRKLKASTQTKNIYRTKRVLSHQEVQISKNYSATSNISLVNQEIEVRFNNPFINLKTRKEFRGEREFYTIISKPITKTHWLEAIHKTNDGTLALVSHRDLQPNLETTITYSTFTKSVGINPRENSLIFGVNYLF